MSREAPAPNRGLAAGTWRLAGNLRHARQLRSGIGEVLRPRASLGRHLRADGPDARFHASEVRPGHRPDAGGRLLGAGRKRNARDASPLFHVDKATVPFLIIHGDKDPIVPVDQSRDSHAALLKAGKDSTDIELPGEGHGFSQPGSLQKLLGSTRQFFAKHLNDGDKRAGRNIGAGT